MRRVALDHGRRRIGNGEDALRSSQGVPQPLEGRGKRLHRLEAACIPSNTGSIKLLEKNGFVREGYAREYLCINGVWQDHLLYGRLNGGSDYGKA